MRDTPGHQRRTHEPEAGVRLHVAKCKHQHDCLRAIELGLADNDQAAGHNETTQRDDVLDAWNAPELAQEPDGQIRLGEQENTARSGPIRDRTASCSNECLDEYRHADRSEKQSYLQSNPIAPA